MKGTGMKKLAILIASFAIGIGAMFGAATVAAQVAPSSITEAVKAPITTSDECMCGGPGVYLSPCTWVPYVGWVAWYWNGYYQMTVPCTPGNA